TPTNASGSVGAADAVDSGDSAGSADSAGWADSSDSVGAADAVGWADSSDSVGSLGSGLASGDVKDSGDSGDCMTRPGCGERPKGASASDGRGRGARLVRAECPIELECPGTRRRPMPGGRGAREAPRSGKARAPRETWVGLRRRSCPAGAGGRGGRNLV